MKEEFYQEYGEKLEELTGILHKINMDLIKLNNHDEEPYQYYLAYFSRTNNNLNTISYLFKMMHIRKHYSETIILTLRSLITHNIIYLYIQEKSKGEESEIIKLIVDLKWDQIKHFTNSFNDFLGQQVHNLGIQDIEKEIEVITDNYVNKIGKPSGKRTFGTTKLFKYLLSNITDGGYKNKLKDMVNYWVLFSKYEHPGALSFFLTFRAMNKDQELELCHSYTDVIDFSINLAIDNFLKWPVDLRNINISELKKVRKELIKVGEIYL